MAHGPTAWFLGLLALLGGSALIWAFARADIDPALVPRPRPVLATTDGKPDIPRLQALATESCRCVRGRESDAARSACWAEFERQAARFRPSPYVTMCQPISPSGYRFGEGFDHRVVKEYSGVPQTSLCSAEEAEMAMAAFNDANRRRAAGDSDADADRAFLEASQALARGEKLAASASGDGCEG